MTPLKRFLLMLTLTCMWSPSFLFVKLAVQDLPPLTIVSLRVSLAALVLGSIMAYKRLPLPTSLIFWVRTSVMALFASVIPFSLFCYAEKSIDSALAAILNGSSPMFTAVLAQMFVASDRLNTQKVIGIACCSCGVIWLFAPNLLEGISGTTLGMSAAVVAAFSYAISHVYGKLYITGQKQFVAPTAQLIASSLIMWPLAFWHDQVWLLPLPSTSAITGICGLALMGTVCAFVIYYKLLEHCGPTAISMVSCFFPVGGMFLGFFFLDESFTIDGLMAAGVILFGMLIVNDIIPLGFLKKPAGQVPVEDPLKLTNRD